VKGHRAHYRRMRGGPFSNPRIVRFSGERRIDELILGEPQPSILVRGHRQYPCASAGRRPTQTRGRSVEAAKRGM